VSSSSLARVRNGDFLQFRRVHSIRRYISKRNLTWGEEVFVNTFSSVWKKFADSKKYRDAFVFSLFKRMVPFQIQALRKQRKWSQQELAKKANLTQGVISRAEDPDYGNLTINTICRIANGFDVAFIGKFVPFSELDKWYVDLSERSVQIPSFQEENLAFEEVLGKIPALDPRGTKQKREQSLGSVSEALHKKEEKKSEPELASVI
jgi:transcriptional regulator with XRE-family HTH domain